MSSHPSGSGLGFSPVAGRSQARSKGRNIPSEGQEQFNVSGSPDRSWRHLHNPAVGIPFLGKYLEQFGLDKITKDKLISHAWRKRTIKLYANYLRKWDLYCLLKGVKLLKPSIAQVLCFLWMLEVEELGYGTTNTARCALSVILPHIDGQTVGKHQLVHGFICSVYERKPSKPKYNSFWDISLVFNLHKA